MKAVVQRVKKTTLSVDNKLISEIEKGLVVYLGVKCGDERSSAEYLAKKISAMRIFEDENGKMNLGIKEVGGQILVVSQFTLLGDTSHGNRPSAAPSRIGLSPVPAYRPCSRPEQAQNAS